MANFLPDHIHLRSRDPKATAGYYRRMFDARIIESARPDGRARFDLDINGLFVCIAEAEPAAQTPKAPSEPYIGLDHFGLRVDDLEEAVEDLRKRGAEIVRGPLLLRPGLKIAFVRAPDDVRIEIVERTET